MHVRPLLTMLRHGLLTTTHAPHAPQTLRGAAATRRHTSSSSPLGGRFTGLLLRRGPRSARAAVGNAHTAAVLRRLQDDPHVEPAAAPAASDPQAAGLSLLLPPHVTTISLPGCGVLCFWQLGVLSTLLQACPPQQAAAVRFIGSSSGALLSVLAATGLVASAPQDIVATAASLVRSSGLSTRRLGLLGRWHGLTRSLLAALLPPDAAAACGGRVSVLATAFPWLFNVHLVGFGSNQQLSAAVQASAHVPLLMDFRWSTTLHQQQQGPQGAAADSSSLPSGTRALPFPHPAWMDRPAWRSAHFIDGNYWLVVKDCYHGFAPLDGSAALVLQPQQDAVLQGVLRGRGVELQQWSGDGSGSDTAGSSASAAAAAAASALVGTAAGGRFGGLASRRLLSEDAAWALFHLGQEFGERALAGGLAPLHIRARP